MIECTDKNIYYKKRHRKNNLRRCFSVLLILLIILGVFYYYKNIICEQIFRITANQTTAFCVESVNFAILSLFEDEIKYENLIELQQNEQGEITLINANPLKINILSRKIAKTTSDVLKSKLNNGVKIPAFAFSGISVLAGYGNEVLFKTMSVTSVDCSFRSDFKSAGINQTLHSIYIDVDVKVMIEMPLTISECAERTSVLVCESIIIGKVPDTYFDGNLFK